MMALTIVVKATAVLAAGLAAVWIAGGARASVRHLILAGTFAALAALPAIAVLAPAVEVEVPVSMGLASAPQVPVPSAMTAAEPASPSSRATPTSIPNIRRTSSPSDFLVPAAGVVWALGALTLLVPAGLGLFRLRRIRREGIPLQHRRQAIEALARARGVGQAVDVLLHDEISVPLTMGVLRPVIVLPADAEAWDDAALRRALVHELEHIRRGDWVSHLGARVVCALYWFHPLVWTAWRAFSLEAERACDDAVVLEAEQTDYADQLVMLARRLTGQTPLAMFMGKRSDLSKRVSSVLAEGTPRGRAGLRSTTAIAAAAAVLVLGLGPVTAISAAQRRQTPERPDPRPPVDLIGDSLGLSLIHASERGRTSRVTALLDTGADVNAAVPGEGSPLIAAASRGWIETVQTLLDRGADPNVGVIGDGNALTAAARRGYPDIVRLLLDRGAQPNAAVAGDGNALIMAAGAGQADIVNILLDRGADLEYVVPGDENALIQASGGGHLEVVQLLIARGANVNARVWSERGANRAGGEWRTPLGMARRGRHEDVVGLLLSAGARSSVQTAKGRLGPYRAGGRLRVGNGLVDVVGQRPKPHGGLVAAVGPAVLGERGNLDRV